MAAGFKTFHADSWWILLYLSFLFYPQPVIILRFSPLNFHRGCNLYRLSLFIPFFRPMEGKNISRNGACINHWLLLWRQRFALGNKQLGSYLFYQKNAAFEKWGILQMCGPGNKSMFVSASIYILYLCFLYRLRERKKKESAGYCGNCFPALAQSGRLCSIFFFYSLFGATFFNPTALYFNRRHTKWEKTFGSTWILQAHTHTHSVPPVHYLGSSSAQIAFRQVSVWMVIRLHIEIKSRGILRLLLRLR